MSVSGHKRGHSALSTGAAAAAASSASNIAAASSIANRAEPNRQTNVTEDTPADDDDDDDDGDDGSDSGSDSDSEYVIVSLPATLVHQLRESGEHIDLHGLDTEQPYFSCPYTLPAVGVAPSSSGESGSAIAIASVAPPTIHTNFTGTYQHSVGTNMIWSMRYDGAAPGGPASSPSTHDRTSNTLTVAQPHAKTISPRIAPTPYPHSTTAPASVGPTISRSSGPHIDFEGTTWKRLVFARQR